MKILFLFFTLHVLIGLERIILFNEILSLLGGFIFFHLIFVKQKIQKKHLPIIIMILWGIVNFTVGGVTNEDGTLYQKLRTSPFLYSILCYFVGYYCFHRFAFIKTKVRSFIIVIGLIFGGKLSPAIGVLLTESDKSPLKRSLNFLILYMFILEGINILLGNFHGSSTLIIICSLLISFRVFHIKSFELLSSRKFSLVVTLMFFFFFVALKYVYHQYSGFYSVGFSYFGGGDSNLLWRLMFWSKLVGEMSIWDWLTGIKLAVPLFDPSLTSNAFIVASEPTAQNRPYTLGPHNSFVYIFVRMGGAFFFLFLWFLLSTLRKLAQQPDKSSKMLAITVCVAVISLSFNVFLETPLYAGIFWVLIGVCQKHIGLIGVK